MEATTRAKFSIPYQQELYDFIQHSLQHVQTAENKQQHQALQCNIYTYAASMYNVYVFMNLGHIARPA